MPPNMQEMMTQYQSMFGAQVRGGGGPGSGGACFAGRCFMVVKVVKGRCVLLAGGLGWRYALRSEWPKLIN